MIGTKILIHIKSFHMVVIYVYKIRQVEAGISNPLHFMSLTQNLPLNLNLIICQKQKHKHLC